MRSFKEVETCVECSGKELKNISEVFYYAQKAVLHPTFPLYDAREHTLQPKAEAALTRIFNLCDKDRDSLLNDDELNAFQAACFEHPLDPLELKGVKEVVRESTDDGLRDNFITLKGFKLMHNQFIEKGYLEMTWAVLRRFGYDDTIELCDAFLHPPLREPPQSDCSTELSSRGREFLIGLFNQYDTTGVGQLDESQLGALFSLSGGAPWESEELQKSMTLDQFLAAWTLLVHDDYESAMAQLAGLGFCLFSEARDSRAESVADAITGEASRAAPVTAPRRQSAPFRGWPRLLYPEGAPVLTHLVLAPGVPQ